MAELLPATQELLLELLEGLKAADPDLPEVRVSGAGRHGARYWLHGQQRRPFDGRRPPAQFDELRAGGYLRKLRSESSGVYYAFTPAAFQLRDKVTRAPAPPKKEPSRPDAPPPELVDAVSMRDQLQQRADRARESLVALAEVSGIETFRNDPSSGVFFVPINPHSWLDLDREHIPLLGAAREHGEAWLVTARLVVATAAPEHLEAFEESAATLRQIYIRGSAGEGPPAGSSAAVGAAIEKASADQLKIIDHLPGAVEPPQLLVVPDTNALVFSEVAAVRAPTLSVRRRRRTKRSGEQASERRILRVASGEIGVAEFRADLFELVRGDLRDREDELLVEVQDSKAEVAGHLLRGPRALTGHEDRTDRDVGMGFLQSRRLVEEC